MKKLLILAAVVSMTALTCGCECWRGVFRGDRCEPCVPAAACPCPCDTTSGCAAPAPMVYAPGPTS